eukprot:scaffold20712_cov100-Isochrysis_galbana.AAC.7
MQGTPEGVLAFNGRGLELRAASRDWSQAWLAMGRARRGGCTGGEGSSSLDSPEGAQPCAVQTVTASGGGEGEG